MNLKNILGTVALAAGIVGCAGPAGHSGVDGTTYGAIYTSATVPSGRGGVTNFMADGPKYTVIGDRVESNGIATNILGWIASGDTGYNALMKKATDAGAKAVIDVYYDADVMDVLGLYCKVTYHMYGVPVKFEGGK